MAKVKECFACDQPATGMDHVPPRCFFPKQKDLPAETTDVRRNLITVPACHEHNGRYSKDDEIASYVILLTHKANRVGEKQFLTKGLRAITGRKGLIAGVFKKIEVFQLPDGTEIPTVQFDGERVTRVMERIARGLFFHDFGHRWNCTLGLLSDGPLMSDMSPSPYRQVIRQIEPTFSYSSRKGTNPAIFWYQWIAGVGGDCTHLLRMCFYDGLKYYVIPGAKKEST